MEFYSLCVRGICGDPTPVIEYYRAQYKELKPAITTKQLKPWVLVRHAEEPEDIEDPKIDQ